MIIYKFIRVKVKVVKAEKCTINQTLSKFSSFEGYPFNLAKIISAWDIDHNFKTLTKPNKLHLLLIGSRQPCTRV